MPVDSVDAHYRSRSKITSLTIAAVALSLAVSLAPSWALFKHPIPVNSVTFSGDGSLLAAGGGYAIYLWDMATGEARLFKWFRQVVNVHVVLSRDGHTLVSSGSARLVSLADAITVWDVTTGRKVRGLMRQGWVKTIALSPDGKLLAAGCFGFGAGNKLRLWDLSTGTAVPFLTIRKLDVSGVAFSPDASKLAVADLRSVRVVDVATRRELWRFQGRGGFLHVAFSPDSSLVAAAAADRTIWLWDARTGKVYSRLSGHTGVVQTVAFSPDGKMLASGSRDRTIRLWDVASRKQLRTLGGHDGWVLSVAFSPDGKTLASGGADGTVRLWDAATGRETRILTLN